jgi:hypothetical protein
MSNDLTPDSIPKAQEPEEPRQEQEPAEQPEFQISEEEAMMAMEVFRQEQNLAVGSLAGLVTAVVGAAIWAAVTVATEYQIGWMAVGVGFIVGMAMRFTGKGIDQIFGVVGAVMALVGCALGNLFTVVYFAAAEFNIPMMDIMSQMTFADVFGILRDTFQVMDILFYGLALYFGYRYAFRQLTLDDFNRALGRAM